MIKKLFLFSLFFCLLTLAACEGQATPVQEVEEMEQIPLPEVIVQNIIIEERVVPVINATGQSESMPNPIQQPSGTATSTGQAQSGQSQPGQLQPGLGLPPPEAIAACEELALEDECSFNAPDRVIEGTCLEIQDVLACVPAGSGPNVDGEQPPGSPASGGSVP